MRSNTEPARELAVGMLPDWGKWLTSFINEGFDNFQRIASLPLLTEKIKRVEKGVTAREMIYDEERLKLYHYFGSGEPKFKTPICFVFAMADRPYLVDIKEGRSVIAKFLEAGFDVYLIDWGQPTRAERYLTLDDYVNGYLFNVVDFLREHSGVGRINLLGYRIGGTLSTIFTAIHQECVRNLILVSTGVDFAKSEEQVSLWNDPHTLDVDKLVDTIGNVPAVFLRGSSLMLKPAEDIIQKQIHLWENLHDASAGEDFINLGTWLNELSDKRPVPGELFREFAKFLFQQNLLVKNRLLVGRHLVDLRRISCPLLNLMSESDDLVPSCQSEPLNDLVSSEDKEKIIWPGGHIELLVRGKAHQELWPLVTDWLRKRTD